jgi:predicted acylesterase/phospholipase RssA
VSNDQVWSDELLAKLEQLTPKQAAAVPRLAERLCRGGSVDSLLAGENRICARQTYYGRLRGWVHQKAFQEALELAKRDYRQALARDSVQEARSLLYSHVPAAVRRLIEIMAQEEQMAQARLAAREILKAIRLDDEDEEAIPHYPDFESALERVYGDPGDSDGDDSDQPA